MSSFNRVILMGNITRDIELRYTPKGTAVTDVSIASNRRVKQGEQWVDETTFVDVTLWGRTAEIANQYLSKGRGIFVEGRLQMDTWQDKETGKNRSRLRVIGETMQFVGGGGSQGGSDSSPVGGANTAQPRENAPSNNNSSTNVSANAPKGGSAAPEQFEDEDDIPF